MTTITSQPKLYSLGFSDKFTYLAALVFILGNIIFPQLCHLFPHGGLILLPIYFFTLLASYKYGWKTGLLTAVLSPIVNSLLFGMPAMAMLPVILVKSVLLATIAGVVAKYYNKITLLSIVVVVFGYQIVGALFEWAYWTSFTAALQDLSIGLPGIALQIIGGYLLLKYVLKN